MNFSRTIRVLIFLSTFNAMLPAWGQDENELYELSLEDLMNVTITSASKTEEKAFDAPSVITTISAQDIADFGGNSLYEILERAPGFYGLSSFIFRNASLGLRGNLPSHISPSILFLIDGRPFRESVFGGNNVGILTTFPIQSIKQIEIIRGPGSVLYGSNAYVGVVNIITKSTFRPHIGVRGSYGSFNTAQAEVSGGTMIGKDLAINGGLKYHTSEGWLFSDSTRIAGPNRFVGNNYMGEEIMSAYLKLDYKGLRITGFHGTNVFDDIALVNASAETYHSQRTFLDVGYTKNILPDSYDLNVNITYNRLNDAYDNGLRNGLSSRIPQANDWVFELVNHITLARKVNLVVGGSACVYAGSMEVNDTLNSIDGYRDRWYHGYFQVNYQPLDWLKLVAGGQFNKVASLDPVFVPRLAVIGSFDSGLGGKLMYGEAFRAPYALEKSIVSPPSLVGNPNLKPELINTLEGQLFYTHQRGRVAATYFRSYQNALITRVPNQAPDAIAFLIYTNANEVTTRGVELEGRYAISKKFYVDGSYTYQSSEDAQGREDIFRLPNHMLKMGAHLNISNHVKLSVFNSYYSSPHDKLDMPNVENSQLEAFSWLTARADINLAPLLNLEKTKAGLILDGTNLLNNRVYNPEIVFSNYNAVQNKPTRGFSATAYIRF